MGKVKTKRAPLHGKAAKVPTSETPTVMDSPAVPPTTHKPVALADNVFSKIDIDLAALARQLPGKDGADDDAKTAITSKSMRGMNLKKKDKLKMRQQFFMNKIAAVQQAHKERKAKKKREKTAVVGDMRPLGDTLPTLDLLLRDLDMPQAPVSKKKTEGEKPKAIKKKATRRKEMLSDLEAFHQVLSHPVYKSDPMGTISQHLHNKLRQEEEMNT